MNLRFFLPAVLCFAASLPAAEVAYLGLMPGGAPSFEEGFDRSIRENLLVNPDIGLLEDETVRLLKQKVDFSRNPAVSRSLVRRLMGSVEDSTVLIWGAVENYSIRPLRRYLLGAAIESEITVSLNIYGLYFRSYAYSGRIRCRTELDKGMVWFYPLSTVHITAGDRMKALESLQQEAVGHTISLVGAILRSEEKKVKMYEQKFGFKKVEDPNIGDLFQMPSMTGDSVETTTGGDEEDTTGDTE